METEKKMVNKFTLTGGKVIFLREPKINDQRTVAGLAGKDTDGNNLLLGIQFAEEMFKQLCVQIGDEKMNGPFSIDKHFNYKEWQQCQKALKVMLGEDTSKNLPMEVVSFGAK